MVNARWKIWRRTASSMQPSLWTVNVGAGSGVNATATSPPAGEASSAFFSRLPMMRASRTRSARAVAPAGHRGGAIRRARATE